MGGSQELPSPQTNDDESGKENALTEKDIEKQDVLKWEYNPRNPRNWALGKKWVRPESLNIPMPGVHFN